MALVAQMEAEESEVWTPWLSSWPSEAIPLVASYQEATVFHQLEELGIQIEETWRLLRRLALQKEQPWFHWVSQGRR